MYGIAHSQSFLLCLCLPCLVFPSCLFDVFVLRDDGASLPLPDSGLPVGYPAFMCCIFKH